ncbi:hypothetical protein AVEN_137202-1, partial [Araneus ventricosus]
TLQTQEIKLNSNLHAKLFLAILLHHTIMERENLQAFRKAPPERFVPVPRQPRTPCIAEVLFRLGIEKIKIARGG